MVFTLKILWVFGLIINCAQPNSVCATLKVNNSIDIEIGDRDIEKENGGIEFVEWGKLNDSDVISVNIQNGCLFRICILVDKQAYRREQKCREMNTSTEFRDTFLRNLLWNGKVSNVLSFDCSCKEVVNEECEPNLRSNCSFIETTLHEDECARLYQETHCNSCRFGYVSLDRSKPLSKHLKGMSMIASVAVRDECFVIGQGFRIFDEIPNKQTYSHDDDDLKVEEKSNINNGNYGMRKFDGLCPPDHNEWCEEGKKPDEREEANNILVISIASVLSFALLALFVMVVFKFYKIYPTQFKLGKNSLAVRYQSKHIKRLNMRDIGHFGVVYDGILKTKDGKLTTVALKYVKSYSNSVYLNSIISEIKIMEAIGKHANVVAFLGSCTNCDNDGDICIIMELCENGSLKKYLENEDIRNVFRNVFETSSTHIHYVRFAEETDTRTDNLSTINLVKWCLEIAKGMEFISLKNIVHFDLAMRNILLSADLTAKISDFGLSQNLQRNGYLTLNQQNRSSIPLPVLYMAPESLTFHRASVKSDIWAYGVCIWEIFSLGDYPNMGSDINLNDVNVRDTLAKKFANGHRLEKPEFSSPEIYREILKCWNMTPSSRPLFTELKVFFENQVQLVNEQHVSQFATGTIS